MHKRDGIKLGSALAAILALAACSSGLDTGAPTPSDEANLSAQATTVTKVIPTALSDAEEHGSSYYNNSTVLELGEKSAGVSQLTGLRFAAVGIPKDSTITSAKLTFVAVTDQAATTSLTIRGEKATNAPEYTSGFDPISARPKTTAVVSWAPGAWTNGTSYSTVDFKAVVQELVNQPGWTTGSAAAFVVTGTGLRKAASYDGGSANAAKLTVTYDVPPTGLSTCLTSSEPRTYTDTTNLRITGLPTNAQVKLMGMTINAGSDVALTLRDNGEGLCVSGGTLKTNAQDNSDWDSVFHGGRLPIKLFNSRKAKVERVAGDVSGDGLHVEANSSDLNGPLHSEDWTLTQSYFRHVGDDIMDNDMRAFGTIDDVLVDWAHTGVACRGYAQGFQRVPGTMTVKNTLFAIKPQASAATGANNHYSPFKWDTLSGLAEGSQAAYRVPCKLVLNNVTIYMAPTSEAPGGRWVFATQGGGSVDPVEFVTSCTNVTFLYGGANYSDTYEAQLDRIQAKFGSSCFKVVEGSAATAEWNRQREAWFARHNVSGFEHIQAYR